MLTDFTKENDKGIVILFLHGWGCDKDEFASLTAEMRNSVNVRLSLWGFGKSDEPQRAWNAADYADALHDFCHQQNLTKFAVVAHSFGGRVALAFAAKYPEMVSRMVLVCSAGLRRFSLKRELTLMCNKIAAKLRLPKRVSADYASTKDSMKGTFVRLVNEDLLSSAKKVKAPVLLVYGGKDKTTPVWIGKRLNSAIENSRLVVFPQGGHFLFAERKTLFKDMVEDFLID